MITAEKIIKCANLNSMQLETLLRKNYPEDMVLASKFVGITNSGEFCYTIQIKDDHSKTGLGLSKIFVNMNDTSDELIADY
jgi:hypothetical protein